MKTFHNRLQTPRQTAMGVKKTTEPNRMIHWPMLGRAQQEEVLRGFVKEYNTRKRVDRKKAKELIAEGKMSSKNLKGEFNQLIKSSHFQLMLELIQQVIGQQDLNNQAFVMTGQHRINASQPYQLSTNNKILANNIGANSCRTIRYQLKRLRTCGFILPYTDFNGTSRPNINHGKLADYELLINPKLLAWHDGMKPDVGTSISYFEKTVKCGFPPEMRKKLPPIELKRTYNNTIDKENVDNPKGTSTFELINKKTSLKNEPRVKDVKFEELKEKYSSAITINPPKKEPLPGAPRKKSPEDLQIEAFILWAVAELYPGYEFYPIVLEKLVKNVKKNFMYGYLDTPERFDYRLEQFRSIIRRQKRYITNNPNRFILSPVIYFDSDYIPASNYDASRFIGGIKLNAVKWQEEKRKEKKVKFKPHFKRWRNFLRLCELPFQKPNEHNMLKIYREVRKNYPDLVHVFELMVKQNSAQLDLD